jgi:hypothetical protein
MQNNINKRYEPRFLNQIPTFSGSHYGAVDANILARDTVSLGVKFPNIPDGCEAFSFRVLQSKKQTLRLIDPED